MSCVYGGQEMLVDVDGEMRHFGLSQDALPSKSRIESFIRGSGQCPPADCREIGKRVFMTMGLARASESSGGSPVGEILVEQRREVGL